MLGEVKIWSAVGGETDTLTVGWLQMDIHWEAPNENIAFLEKLWPQVAAQAQVWVLPEMWATGFSVSERAAETEPGPAFIAMQTWAKTYDILLIGSLKVQTSDGHLYNRAYAVSPTGAWDYYDKRHLFRMAGEEKLFTAGTHRLITLYKGWRIAILICYDLRFAVWSRRTDAFDYEVLIYVANWPAIRSAHWEKLLPARAIENQAYVLGVNRVGTDATGKAYIGKSALYSPLGEPLLSSGESQGPARATIHKKSLHTYRERFPAWMDGDLFYFA
mgnify:CR=1 FL=1